MLSVALSSPETLFLSDVLSVWHRRDRALVSVARPRCLLPSIVTTFVYFPYIEGPACLKPDGKEAMTNEANQLPTL